MSTPGLILSELPPPEEEASCVKNKGSNQACIC